MINKCPHCGFEPLDGAMVCPKCGTEIKENIARKLADIEVKNMRGNESVAWDDFKDVSLGSVMDTFSDDETSQIKRLADEMVEQDQADEEGDNPILAAYIAGHRDFAQDPEPTKVKEAKAKAEAKESVEKVAVTEEVLEAPLKDEVVTEEPLKEEPIIEASLPEETVTEGEPVAEETVEDAVSKTELAETELATESNEEAPLIEEPSTSEDVSDVEPIFEESVVDNTTPEQDGAVTEPIKAAESFESTEGPELPVAGSMEEVASQEVPNRSNEEATLKVAPKTEATPNKPKRNKKPLVIAAALAVIAGGGGLFYHNYTQAKAAQHQEEVSAYQDLAKQLAEFYAEGDQEFPNSQKTTSELTKLVANLKEHQALDDDAKDTYSDAQELLKQYQQVDDLNALFEKPILTDGKLNKNVALKANAPIKLAKADFDNKATYNKVYNEAITIAETQEKDLQVASNLMAKLYGDGKKIDQVSQAEYQEAKTALDKLANGSQKTELNTELTTVKTALDKKAAEAKKAAEKAAAEKAAKEAQAAAATAEAQESANATSANNSNLPAEASPNMQTNNNNQPILGTVQSDVNDTANPAWTWAPGVLEQVLATCKARGYIVDGGYSLVPVRIENGEGYYNLFATNNQSSFTKGYAAKDLPVYLVTINDKTGYFRGNGNDHTIR